MCSFITTIVCTPIKEVCCGFLEFLDWEYTLLNMSKLYFNCRKNTFPLHSIFACADTAFTFIWGLLYYRSQGDNQFEDGIASKAPVSTRTTTCEVSEENTEHVQVRVCLNLKGMKRLHFICDSAGKSHSGVK